MTRLITVRHRTVYTYANPVLFGDHRMMCRPRDSHDLRLIETGLTITPAAQVRWLHDVFGNSIAIARFAEPGTELVFDSTFTAEHFPAAPRELELEPYATTYPFSYPAEEVPDIARLIERHYSDPLREIDAWSRPFVQAGANLDTMSVLVAMTKAVKAQFSYARREEVGTQTPVETLQLGTGSCRDFALFMIEAVRSLGFAARFVSGYLYDEKLVGAENATVGGGATHAWVQVYLPGAGWVEFDPTNALVGGRNLIRVAVARDAAQAVPLAGSFKGASTDFLDMSVDVEVGVA
ncbi:MAG: transglutaminase family protein [Nevskia sp.]